MSDLLNAGQNGAADPAQYARHFATFQTQILLKIGSVTLSIKTELYI